MIVGSKKARLPARFFMVPRRIKAWSEDRPGGLNVRRRREDYRPHRIDGAGPVRKRFGHRRPARE
ncbi:hypothetical protein TR75_02245 [Hydrogenibacillus schlegelii]|uniref:Uncharacterized protein n=1 Tax=Hydrogenibacillus schlegelii TaxID=1484 RepID=A0A132NCL5_HYDSH|nr:hypothetical protein TR75_02245 [Hydrogenibacillus schlegelii]OAR03247.1 hypothetical protein SA87_05030 [Hydrogenibacillus schlegelii]PTQ53756.1 MAG: hypothetical protein HSCHL_1524 [Hydrogenibacillus schlegelii]